MPTKDEIKSAQAKEARDPYWRPEGYPFLKGEFRNDVAYRVAAERERDRLRAIANRLTQEGLLAPGDAAHVAKAIRFLADRMPMKPRQGSAVIQKEVLIANFARLVEVDKLSKTAAIERLAEHSGLTTEGIRYHIDDVKNADAIRVQRERWRTRNSV